MIGSFDELDREGRDLLRGDDPLAALERFVNAEAAAEAEGRERELCGMLGDKAVAFNRVGNTKAAIATYRRAIDLCRRYDDALNLSRWTSNLVNLLSLRGRPAEAEAFLNEMLDAALRSGKADQISVAKLNQATLLSLQGRHESAIRCLEEAAQIADENTLDVIRQNRFAIYQAWGETLRRERRGKEAIAALETALRFADETSTENRKLAMLTHLLLADLYERAGDTRRSNAASQAARKLSEKPASDVSDLVLPEPQSSSPTGPTEPRAAAGMLRDELAADNELTDQVNRTGALLNSDPDKAMAEFEELLLRLRRLQDRRRELILILNFLPEFLARSELDRAAYLAERCLELSQGASTDHRIVALLHHATAAHTALHNDREALGSYREASRLLQEWADAPADFRKNVFPMLTEGALLAVDNEDLALATEIATAIGLKLPKVPKAQEPRVPDVEELRAMTRPDLDAALSAWAAGAEARPSLSETEQAVPFAGWRAGVTARLNTKAATVAAASQGGPAGLLHLGELVAKQRLPFSDARTALATLSLDPDAATVCCFHALRHIGGGTASAIIRLVAETTPDDRLAAHLDRLLLAMAAIASEPDHMACLGLVEAGLQRLAAGADEALRAELLNESAVHFGQLGQRQQALSRAEIARDLAQRLGLDRLACMAAGNVAMSLMQLGQAARALEVLKALEAKQERRGEADQLEITRFNIRAARMMLGDRFVTFDADSDDPDEVFNSALTAADNGDHYASTKLFERGLALVAQGRPSHTIRAARRYYATSLAAVKRTEDALSQLAERARSLERDDMRSASEVYVQMAQLAIRQTARVRVYAESALRTARAAHDAKLEATALRLVGDDGGAVPAEDVRSALDELGRQDGDPASRVEFARIHLATRRPAEALAVLGGMEDDETLRQNPALKVSFFVMLGRAHALIGNSDAALAELRRAHEAGLTLGPEPAALDASKEFGLELLRQGRASKAVEILEACLERLRPLKNLGAEHSVGLNLSLALAGAGDALGADRILVRVCEASRAGGQQAELGRALAARGQIALNRGRLDAALEHLATAADLGEETSDRLLQAGALDTIGLVLSASGSPGRAVEYHDRAVALYHELGAADDEIIARLNLAETLIVIEDAAAAERALRDTMVLIPSGASTHAARLRFLAALVTALQGHWAAARPVLQKTLDRLQRSQGSGASPAQMLRRVRRGADAYRLAVRAAIRAKDARFAVEILEGRRIGFLDAVIERRARRPAGVDRDTWLRYEQSADAVAELRAERRAASLTPDPSLDERLSAAERSYAAAFRAVYADGGETTADEQARGLPRFEELMKKLPRGVASAYIDVSDRLEVVCAGRRSNGALWAEALANKTLTAADLPPSVTPADAERVCALLGERLWPALIGMLPAKAGRLVLLPSARLAAFPLGAAIVQGDQTAAERFRLAIAPSLALLTRTGIRAESLTEPATLGQAIDPTSDLPFSRCEARAVAAAHRGPVVASPESQATVPAVLQLLRTTDILHFAGHGVFDPHDPVRSYLQCARSGDDPGRLGITTVLAEVAEIQSRLVVLSSCASGAVVSVNSSDEFVGLPGTFLVAGAGAVIATHWEIGDLEAALFVHEFFAMWNGGKVAASQAVGQAQLRLRTITGFELARVLRQWSDAAPDEVKLREAAKIWEGRADGAAAFPGVDQWGAFHFVGLP